MNKKLALRSAKLLSESQKLKTSSNVCVAYEHQPQDPDERKHGILFAVIDVNGNPKHSEELIELIIDTFHGEYYQDLDKDSLESFENALAKINEELGEYTNSGNTFWMGKLNALLAVYADNTIHLTQSGKAESFFYRGGKESHVSKDLAGDSVNPLRTFVNITSGEVLDGDKVSIFSSGILASCTTEELARYINKYHPRIAINHIANLIEGVGGSYGQNSAIVMEFLTPEALANESLDEEPEEVWLKGAGTKEIISDGATGILGKFFIILKMAIETIFTFFASTVFPYMLKTYGFLKKKTSNLYSKYVKKESVKDSQIMLDTDEEIANFEDEDEKLSDTEVLESNEKESKSLNPSYKSEIRIKESDESPNKAFLEKTKSSILSNLGALYGSATKLSGIKKPRKMANLKIKKNYFLIVAIVILIFIIPYGLITRQNRTDAKIKKDEKTRYESMTGKVSEANTLDDKEKAFIILEDAKKMAEELTRSKFFAKESQGKLDEINSQIDTITKTTKVDAPVFADLSEVTKSDIVGIYSIGNAFYAISKNGDVTKVEKKSKKVSKVQTSGKVEGNVLAATALVNIKTVDILTDKPSVYEFDTENGSIKEKFVSDSWERASDIDSYGTNLYLLSPDDNQLYKHTRTSTGYGKKSPYISGDIDIKSALSMKIDSDVYILKSGGEIEKYTSGKKQDFNIKEMYVKPASANTLYTGTDIKNIFVMSLSDKYVSAIDKAGIYKAKYISDSFNDMRNIFSEGNTIYIATKDKILSFDMP